jgi:hypothetical protein
MMLLRILMLCLRSMLLVLRRHSIVSSCSYKRLNQSCAPSGICRVAKPISWISIEAPTLVDFVYEPSHEVSIADVLSTILILLTTGLAPISN